MPRFALAIVAILIGAVAIAESLWYAIYETHSQAVVLELCGVDSTTPDLCQAEQRSRILWTIGFAPLLAVVASAGAAAASWMRRRRLALVPVDALPAVTALNERAAASIGAAPAPLVWRPTQPIMTARADGMFARHVEIGPGWLATSMSDPALAEAILRHEYAHHRNRDVVVARLTVAATGAFVVLLGWLVVEFRSSGARVVASAVTHGAVLFVIAALARSSVLRAREYDADAAAAAEGGDSDRDPLRRALLAGRDEPVAASIRLRRVFADHPEPAHRIACIDDPHLLHRPKLADAALVGLTAGVGAPVVTRLLEQWKPGSDLALYSAGIAWAAVGVGLGCWLTVVLWGVAHGGTDAAWRRVLPFGGVLGACLALGNLVFTDTALSDRLVVPKHTTDTLTSLALAVGLPLGAIWILQLMDGIAARRPSASLFRGVGALTGVVSVATVASLLAVLGFVHAQAVRFSGNPELSLAGGTDVDSPLTFVDIARVWNQEWMGYLLPALALVGALVLGLTSNAWRRVNRPVVVGVIAALAGATLGTVALWFLRERFDIVDRALDAGWLAVNQVTAISPAVAGVSIAATVGVAVLALPRARVVAAGAFAVVASVLACIAIEAWLLPGDGSVSTLARDVVPIAVVGSMLIAALSGRGAASATRWAAWSAVGVTLIAAVSWTAVDSTSARAPADFDRDRYVGVITPHLGEGAPLINVLLRCDAETFDAQTVDDARQEHAALSDPLIRPSSPALQDVHDNLLDVLRLCGDSAERAIDPSAPATTDEQRGEIADKLTTLVVDLTDLVTTP